MTVDELIVGSQPPGSGERTDRDLAARAWRRVSRLWLVLGAGALLVAVAFQLAPSLAGTPRTGVTLVVAGESFLLVDVDTGRTTALSGAPDPSTVVTQGSRIIALQPQGPDDLAPPVLTLGPDQVEKLGGADALVAGPTGGGVWLMLDAVGRYRGSATYFNASGSWRTPILPMPRRYSVVGAVPDGLLVMSGQDRDQRLSVYDPRNDLVIRRLGSVGTVLAAGGPIVTTTVMCWVTECPMYTVDTRTGVRSRIEPPTGTLFSGRPVPSPDGTQVAAVVRRLVDGSAALAVGTVRDGLRVVDDVRAQPGATVEWTTTGWVAVPNSPTLVTLWRGGQSREVALPAGTRMVAVRSG
ncbi:MAG: hypothetical protein WAN48_07000 [Actinomycetes bacterium]